MRYVVRYALWYALRYVLRYVLRYALWYVIYRSRYVNWYGLPIIEQHSTICISHNLTMSNITLW